jgi:LPS-assembly protein
VPNGIAQTDVSFHWPIYDDWYLMGRWLYALNYNATKESFIGLEKDSCCWRFSIIGRRYSNALSNTVQSQLQTGIFVQLELKGLGSFGDKVDQFLENNISGYLSPHKND